MANLIRRTSTSWPAANTNGASGPTKIAIGENAGLTTQGTNAVAIGVGAGETNQAACGVAIGVNAGNQNQGSYGVAVGGGAGNISQGADAVAIGVVAGNANQGESAVAIGHYAGPTSQGANSIIINATGSPLNQTTASTFTVKPVRLGGANFAALTGFSPCYYNPTTGEFIYTTAGTDADLAAAIAAEVIARNDSIAAALASFSPTVLAALSALGFSTTVTVAATGSNQSTAALLTGGIVYNVTGANLATAVRLPPVGASILIVYNSTAAYDLRVYPATGELILPNNANAQQNIATQKPVIFIPLNSTSWVVLRDTDT